MPEKHLAPFSPDEIPFDQTPRGKSLGTYTNQGDLSRQFMAVSFVYFFGCGILTFFSFVFNGIPDAETETFSFLAFLLFIATIVISGSICVFFFVRREYLRGQTLEMFEDGFIFRERRGAYRYLWWLNLVDYQVSGQNDTLRLILKMNDGRRFTLTQEYPSLPILIHLLPRVTGATLFNRTIEQLAKGDSVPFGALTLNMAGLGYNNKRVAWPDVLLLEFYPDIKKYVIWVRDADEADSGTPAPPRRFATIHQNRFPNQQVLLDFMQELLAYKARVESISHKSAKLQRIWERWRLQRWHQHFDRAKNAVGMVAVGILLIGIGVSGVDRRIEPNPDQVDQIRSGLAFLIGFPSLALGLLEALLLSKQAVATKLQPDVTLALYDTGIAITVGTTDFSCPWSKLREYRLSSKLPHWAANIPGMPVGTEIVRSDGQSLYLNHAIDVVPAFLREFRVKADEVLRPVLEESLCREQGVEFGPLHLSLTTLTYHGKTIDCTEVANCHIERGWLLIFTIASATEMLFARINMRQIPNNGILLDWLNTLIKQNGRKRSGASR